MDMDMMVRSSSSSSSGDEYEMDMMAMIQMEHKLTPDLYGSFYGTNFNAPNTPEFDFSTGTTRTPPAIFHGTPLINTPTSTNSFNATPPFHDHMMNAFPSSSSSSSASSSSVSAMREIIFRIAAMQPIHIDPESVKPPKRRNVKISKDPQSVAARHRRERISERIRILQRLVPGGTKMDTASMLDEAIHYMKFLKKQVQTLEQAEATTLPLLGGGSIGGFSTAMTMGNANYSNTRAWNQRAQNGCRV